MIYLARDLEYVKIGVAQASNLLRRWMELQIGNPRELEFRVWDKGAGQEMERALHLEFKGQNVRGEWFNLNGKLAEMWDASEPINRRKTMGRPGVIKPAAIEWLLERLADGPVQVSVLIKEAKPLGFVGKTLRRAATDLRIVRPLRSAGAMRADRIVWSLPQPEASNA